VADEDPAGGELVITVYLDTNVLLDLLATVEDGFSLLERVTSGQTADSASERSGNADFGSPRIFSLFRFGFSGKLGKSTTKGASETIEAERTHTYGSLLHRLRSYLVQEDLVTTMTAGEVPVDVGHFIEFTGVVRPNPFTASFQRLSRMLRFVDVAMALGDNKQTPSQGQKAKGGQHQARATPANKQASQLKAIREFLEQITTDVEREGTSTVVLESQTSGYTAVVTLFDDFLRDRSMAELLNREFRVLGKVARHLPRGSVDGVDLLASSGISGFPPEILAALTEAIDEMSVAGAAQVGTPSTTIAPPVIEIIPIAIYL
jgi:hypothetical protein